MAFLDETGLAEPLAGRMALCLNEEKVYDCIVPVPISRERLRERGKGFRHPCYYNGADRRDCKQY